MLSTDLGGLLEHGEVRMCRGRRVTLGQSPRTGPTSTSISTVHSLVTSTTTPKLRKLTQQTLKPKRLVHQCMVGTTNYDAKGLRDSNPLLR